MAKRKRNSKGLFIKQTDSIVSNDIFIPNHSGMLDAGKVHRVPTDDLDPVNKLYVDDSITNSEHWTNTSNNTGTNKILDDFSNLIEADQIHIQVRNESGSDMTRGQLVYISGYNLGLDRVLVKLTDANGSATFPAIGILDEDAANNQDAHCTVNGRFTDINTNSFNVGDSVYMSETPGAFSAKPISDDSRVQAIGIVLRKNINNGVLQITGAGRTNDIPNTIDLSATVATDLQDFLLRYSTLTGWSTWLGGGSALAHDGVTFRVDGKHIHTIMGDTSGNSVLAIGVKNENYPRTIFTAGGDIRVGGNGSALPTLGKTVVITYLKNLIPGTTGTLTFKKGVLTAST